MNYSEAIGVLQAECNALPSGQEKTDLQAAIDKLYGQSSSLTDEEALEICNNTYWDVTLNDRCLFGQGMFTISYTVDPSKPNPHTREN